MSRRPQKGVFTTATTLDDPRIVDDLPSLRLTTVTSYGQGVVDEAEVDLAAFATTPLIANNFAAVRTLMRNKTPNTLRAMKRHLSAVQAYTLWYANQFGSAPETAPEVTPRFTHQFLVYQVQRDTGENYKSSRTRWFKRFLTAIGVPPTLLPPNSFRDDGNAEVEDTLDAAQAKQILNRAKFEIGVVRRRFREAHQLAASGHDPRREAGGAPGDWAKNENRAWVIKRLLKRELHTFDDMRFKLGYRTVLAGLENQPGAEVVQADGSVSRLRGWNGHLRWFFPWPDDLAPFAALLMLRTGWNATTVSAVQSRRWMKPYPYRIGAGEHESHAYVVSYKTRGRAHELDPSKEERFPSARRPYSHPYRLLKTVEYLTVGLRKEILRRRSLLLAVEARTASEEKELKRLESIKDDLFIFKTEQGISSFRHMMSSEGVVEPIGRFLGRAGAPHKVRHLRDATILFSYEASGQNLFIAQFLANHADQNTTTLYLRRQRTLQRIWSDAISVFDASLKLIEQGTFSGTAVRQMLLDQGYRDDQVDNLLDRKNTTRWGNRCADPTSPPRGFDRQAQGGACRTQDCIDGCPHARWFSESVDHVARQLVTAERSRAKLGLESTEGSSLDSRIERCNVLLDRWPQDIRRVAVDAARARGAEADDFFLGPAL